MNRRTSSIRSKLFTFFAISCLLQAIWQTCAASEDLSIWTHLKVVNCRRLLHIRLSDHHYYDDSGLNMANADEAVMISSRNWTQEKVNSILDPQAKCIIHILINDYNTSNFLPRTLQVLESFRNREGLEHFLVLTSSLSCVENSSSWLHDSLEPNELLLYPFVQRSNLRPFMVVVELQNNLKEITLIHSFWFAFCPSFYYCVYTLNTSELSDPVTGAGRIQTWILQSFSQSDWQLPLHNKQWSLGIAGMDVFYSKDLTPADVAKYRLRHVLVQKSVAYMDQDVPLLKVALEIAQHLNASSFAIQGEPFPPMTIIEFHPSYTKEAWMEAIVISAYTFNFMHCYKNALVVDSSDPFLIFQPFGTSTWAFSAFSLLALCLFCRYFKQRIPSYVMFRAILQPRFDAKNYSWIASGLLVLWTLGCFLLGNLYSSEIQSLYVVPIKLEPFKNCKDLAQAHYRLLYPEPPAKTVGVSVEKLYWYGLENTVEFIDDFLEDEEFWRHFFESSKLAALHKDDLLQSIAQFVNDLAGSERCYIGSEPILLGYWQWSVVPPNAGLIKMYLQYLQEGGIMELYFTSYRQKDVDFLMRLIKVAIREPALGFVHRNTLESDKLTMERFKMVFIYVGIGLMLSLGPVVLAIVRDLHVKIYLVYLILRHISKK